MFSFRPVEEIEALIMEHQLRPESRLLQETLAMEMVTLVHSEDVAITAKNASLILFGHERLGGAAEDLQALGGILRGTSMYHTMDPAECYNLKLVDLLVKLFPDHSKSINLKIHSPMYCMCV